MCWINWRSFLIILFWGSHNFNGSHESNGSKNAWDTGVQAPNSIQLPAYESPRRLVKKISLLQPWSYWFGTSAAEPWDSNFKMFLRRFWYISTWGISALVNNPPGLTDELQTIPVPSKLQDPAWSSWFLQAFSCHPAAWLFITLSNVTQLCRNSYFTHFSSSLSLEHLRKYDPTLKIHIQVNIMFF